MSAESLWELQRVSLGARLQEISVKIPRGSTAVIGWSGAGKTSLLNLLVGFEKPSGGRLIPLLGDAPERFPPGETRARFPLAWVPQNGGLWPNCSVREHLELAAVTPSTIEALLVAFDLQDRGGARPDELSEGEQSRLAVARALAMEAAVLVMDEPLVHVDLARAGGYWQTISKHLAAHGASLVFSTHVAEHALGYAEHAICLHRGEMLYQGPMTQLYAAPPTPELMTFLGSGNWLTPEEAQLWLETTAASARCFRPEQIELTATPAGTALVESSCFMGSMAETHLRHEHTGAQRTFFHRPRGAHLLHGMRIHLTTLCLALALLLAGCAPPASTIPVHAWTAWMLPSDGPAIPTPRSVAIGQRDEIAVLDTAGRVLVYDAAGTLLRSWKMLDVSVGKPEGIAVLKDGRIVVCDTHYHRIVYFDPEGKVLHTFGKKGEGAGEFFYPVGITKDTDENLYICEYGGHDRVQKFTREGRYLLEFGRFGTQPGEFQRPSGLVWHLGKIYVTDAVNHRVLIFSDTGAFLGLLGEAQPIAFDLPYDISVGNDGALFIIEYGAGRLSRVSLAGRLLGRYGHSGNGEGEFGTPWGLAIDSQMRVRIADTRNRRIVTLQL